jgi:hypothetical protein
MEFRCAKLLKQNAQHFATLRGGVPRVSHTTRAWNFAVRNSGAQRAALSRPPAGFNPLRGSIPIVAGASPRGHGVSLCETPELNAPALSRHPAGLSYNKGVEFAQSANSGAEHAQRVQPVSRNHWNLTGGREFAPRANS